MRIAFLNHPWSRTTVPVKKADSIAIWTYEVARRLAKEHEVVVFGRRFPGQEAVEVHEGVRYRRFERPRPFGTLHNLTQRLGVSPVSRASMFYDLSYAYQVAAQLRRESCDVLHVHNLSHYVPLIRSLEPRTRLVLHMHCEWMSQIGRRTALSRLEHVSRVVGCSRYIAERIENRFPRLAARCGVLHNGVDPSLFGDDGSQAAAPPPDGGVILFVGRITPEKGIHDLMQAFALVLSRRPRAELRIVGPHEPTPLEYIVRMSQDARVRDLERFYPNDYLTHLKRSVSPEVLSRVRFVGEVDRTELSKEFRAAHVLANPSLSESFGMSLVEAMASRVPVVATRVGGMQNVVEEGRTGLLVPAADPLRLSEALLCVLSDGELRNALIDEGRRSVEARFSWDTVAKDAFAHYDATRRGDFREVH